MNILSKVTRRFLIKNRVRTTVTVLGILLSAAMITAVTVSAASIQRYLQGTMRVHYGDWHVSFHNVDAEGREALEADERTASAAWAQIDWALLPRGEDTSLAVVFGADGAFLERMPVALSQGRLPENPGEIVLSQVRLGDVDTKLGSTVTLKLGDRDLNGLTLSYGQGPLNEGETLRVRATRTFTVVGYLATTRFDRNSGADIVGLTCFDPADDAPLNGYLLLRDPGDTYDMQMDYWDRYVSQDNRDYLMALGYSRYDTFTAVLYSFAAILIGLIMFGSVSLIYNAFSISVAQRTKEYGLLRSVGATKKQLRSMVLTEALTVSAIGIPLGVLSGILGMAVTFHFIGGALGQLFNGYYGNLEVPAFALYVTPGSVIAAAVIGLVTVLISTWIPSRRALRVSAVEAIRQSGDVRIKPREVKTSPVTYRLFGLEGTIAAKHFKRNRKGYRATVLSLFMSVVLFISASSFCRYLTDMVTTVFEEYDYDIYLYSYKYTRDPEDNDPGTDDLGPLTEAISRVGCVTSVTGVKTLTNAEGADLTRDMMSERAIELLGGAPGGAQAGAEPGERVFPQVYGVEDSAYRAYLAAHGLSEEEYMGEHPKVIVSGRVQIFNRDSQRIEEYELFREDLEELTLRFTDQNAVEDFFASDEYNAMTPEEQDNVDLERFVYTETFEVGLVTDDLLPGVSGVDLPVILMPLSEARRLDKSTGDQIELYISVSDHVNGLAQIVSAVQAAGFDLEEGNFHDLYADTAANRSVVTVVRVVSYGFIALISLIAALNVFNTISTNILLRRREFAMLRSVGMTDRGFNRMMNYECLLYGAKALLFGIPVAFGVTYLIYRSVMRGMDTGFYLPWTAVLIAVGSVFLVVFASMLYSMSGIKRDNPIEAMRAESI